MGIFPAKRLAEWYGSCFLVVPFLFLLGGQRLGWAKSSRVKLTLSQWYIVVDL